ncbi:hypothetical protein F0L17_09945 [Streptomyces sp. TRM43335]|uniref:Uncharacterized protein n=1 Tax=Streptomyces taklimakanensis TaxID=2569853 RepID=A0A6G2BBK4_9ACTN|nr:hypothetical protein [Streptomyces taklimakanensis]MTE19443.1 hypothetical protein [Streptomyces taklimakanensis]
MWSLSEPYQPHNSLVVLLLVMVGVVGTPTLALRGLWIGVTLLVRAGRVPAAVTWTAAVKSVALLVWAGAAGVYTWGVLYLAFTDDYGQSLECDAVAGEGRVVDYEPSFVPLRFGCRLDDGRTVDVIVPDHVNAWAFPLAGCALVLTLIVRARDNRSAKRGADGRRGAGSRRHPD